MKKAFFWMIVLMMALPAFGQSAARYDSAVYTVNAPYPIPGGFYPVLAYPGAKIAVCTAPANAVPCTNYATTYTNAAEAGSCPSPTQLTRSDSTTCVGTADAEGGWGVWMAGGNYQYTVTTVHGSYGPYDFSVGSGGIWSGPTLQTNGANNGSQSLLNLVAGTNVTLSNTGGAVTINATGAGGCGTSSPGYMAYFNSDGDCAADPYFKDLGLAGGLVFNGNGAIFDAAGGPASSIYKFLSTETGTASAPSLFEIDLTDSGSNAASGNITMDSTTNGLASSNFSVDMEGTGTNSGIVQLKGSQGIEFISPVINFSGISTGTCASGISLDSSGNLVKGDCGGVDGAVLLNPTATQTVTQPSGTLFSMVAPEIDLSTIDGPFNLQASGDGSSMSISAPTIDVTGTTYLQTTYLYNHMLGFAPENEAPFSGITSPSAALFQFGNGTSGDTSGTIDAAILNAGTGFQLAGAAPTGHCLVGNGTDYVDNSECAYLNASQTFTGANIFTGSVNMTTGSFGVNAIAFTVNGSTLFNIAGAATFQMAPTGAATSGVNTDSTLFDFQAGYWNGSAAQRGGFHTLVIPASGSNPLITLTHTFVPIDTGSGSGTATGAETFEYPVNVAVSGGVGGTFSATEGTAPSAASGKDILYADSTSHCMMYSANGGSFSCLGSDSGGSPGGSSGNLQYNNAGSFGGDADTSDDGAGNIQLTTVQFGSGGPKIQANPSTPGEGTFDLPTLTSGQIATLNANSSEIVSYSATPTFNVNISLSKMTLTGNVTTFTLGTANGGLQKQLCFEQGSGPYTVTPPSNVAWFRPIGTLSGYWYCQSFVYDATDSLWINSDYAGGDSGIANTTFTVGTTAVAANTCTSASTVTMTGVATTSVFSITPNADVSGVTGWGSTGGLVIDAWPTANTANMKVCNQTASSITPSASVTFNLGAR